MSVKSTVKLVLAQFFKKSFSFQLVDQTFIDKLLDVYFTLRFTVPGADQLERIADTVSLDSRWKRKLRGEIRGWEGIENRRS